MKILIDREVKLLEKSEYNNKILVYFDKQKDFKINWIKIVSILEFDEYLIKVLE